MNLQETRALPGRFGPKQSQRRNLHRERSRSDEVGGNVSLRHVCLDQV